MVACEALRLPQTPDNEVLKTGAGNCEFLELKT